ncbi:MAG: hypothetical protein HYY68_00030 [Thaumarchaeota archaeon]|nr:hypothetical protein [Nitrososphaerota archaeon]
MILVSNVMTEEKKPRYTNFAEFALKLLYDLSDSDRVISVSHVQQTLSEWFREVNNIQDNDMVIFHATGKLQQRISGRLAIQAKKPQYSHVR